MDHRFVLSALGQNAAQENAAEIDAEIDAETERAETEWIAAAKTDLAAFEPLYLRYRERIYQYLRVRSASDEDAADATQEVFLRAMTALPRYQTRGIPVVVWLLRIARHLALNEQRHQRPWVSWDALPDRQQPTTEQDVAQDVELLVQRREELERLTSFLGALKPPERELLALRYAAGLSAPEIAAVIGKRPPAIRKHLSRLLQSFREHYAHENH
jgi:RNA polymerase sigma-70 factor, ECF subfamily